MNLAPRLPSFGRAVAVDYALIYEIIPEHRERASSRPDPSEERIMGNRDRRGREAKKPKKAKDQRAPAKSRFERTPAKPTPAVPDSITQR
jgi:hypothetical protein